MHKKYHEAELVTTTPILKPNNVVRIEYQSEFDPFGKAWVSNHKIISELKRYVILDNGWTLAKPDGRPYSFCGTFLGMVEVVNGANVSLLKIKG